MKGLAQKLAKKEIRPGIWLRLLLNEDPQIPDSWRLPHNGCLDPSHPDALEYIRQHRAFFDIDADCVGIAGPIPWELNRQWADVLAESGTPLFVSAKPGVLNEQEKEELHQIMLKGSLQNRHKIPADWQDTDCPEVWTDENGRIEYNWYEPEGADLVGNDGRYHLCIPPS